jgi:ribosomal protein L17
VRKTARRAYEKPASSSSKTKRAPSEYNKKFSAAFKKVAPKFKKKNGGWVKDGFKRAGAAARKAIK